MPRPRLGDWLQTHNGIQFYPLDPRPEDFILDDIAHGLSMTCRYGGHVNSFYSVAQHSVLVSYCVPAEFAKEALLHDASEAYLGDVVHPLKKILPRYKEIEARVEAVLAERFGLTWPWPDVVKDADLTLMMAERRDLLQHQKKWIHHAEPLPMSIAPVGPTEAKSLFLSRACELEVF